MAEKTDLEKMQFSELQKAIDLGLRLGHISMRNTCRTNSVPDHVTVASSSRPTHI